MARFIAQQFQEHAQKQTKYCHDRGFTIQQALNWLNSEDCLFDMIMFLSNCLALSCCCFASNVCFGLQECPGIEVNVPIGGRNYVAIPSLNADQPTQYQISHGLRGIAQEECFCSLLYAVFVL